MDPNRKLWNANHQKLNRALASGDREKAIELFLDLHAMVHSSGLSKSKLWSFEDEILNDMSKQEIRKIPGGSEHSIAWILLHVARIEDITMNMLVAGAQQLFHRDNWARKMNVSFIHSANKMDNDSVAKLSAKMDLDAVRAYRIAVGRRTREIVKKLRADEFRQKVDPLRIQKIISQGAITEQAIEIANYWSNRSIAGLLLMPATRHNILHLNEALRIKQHLIK